MAVKSNKNIVLMDASGRSVEYARLQMRRGPESQFDASKMLPAEFAVTTDTEKVHISFSPGKTKQLMTVDDALEEVQEKADEILASIPEDYTQLVDEVGSLSEKIDECANSIFFEKAGVEKRKECIDGIASLKTSVLLIDSPFENKSFVESVLIKSKLRQSNPYVKVFVIYNNEVKSMPYDGEVTGTFNVNEEFEVMLGITIQKGESIAIYSETVSFASYRNSLGEYLSYSGDISVGSNITPKSNKGYSLSVGYIYKEYINESKIEENSRKIYENAKMIEENSIKIEDIKNIDFVESEFSFYNNGLDSTLGGRTSIDVVIVNRDKLLEDVNIKNIYIATSKGTDAGNYTVSFFEISEDNKIIKEHGTYDFETTKPLERVEIPCEFTLLKNSRIGVKSNAKLAYNYNIGKGMDWYNLDSDGNLTSIYASDTHSFAIGYDYSVYVDKYEQKNRSYDVFLFCGQSNMAGRGESEKAPKILDGAGFEFKSVTDPTKLYPIEEPFGKFENDEYIYNLAEGNTPYLSGGMVTAFVNAYYLCTNTPVIAVFAAQGGTSTDDWIANKQEGALVRYNKAIDWLTKMNYKIGHKYVLWCQGETDGDNNVDLSVYKDNISNIISNFINAGIEKFLMVRIGNCNAQNADDRYKYLIDAQTEIAKTNRDVVMVSTTFAGMKERGLMKDDFHYFQEGYNECGNYAGVNSGVFSKSGKEPTMYDPEYDNLYFCKKN